MTYSETIRHYGNPFTIWTEPEMDRIEVYVSTECEKEFVILPFWGQLDRGCRFYHGFHRSEIYFGKNPILPGRRD